MRKNSYEYRHYNHAVGLCVVHLVWIPKRRKKLLVGKIRDRIFQIFSELAIEKDWRIRALEVAPDHIHLFVEIHPNDAIYQVAKAFKGRSANY
jgi:putative transposase